MKRKKLTTAQLVDKIIYHDNQNWHNSDDKIIKVLLTEFAKRLGVKLC